MSSLVNLQKINKIYSSTGGQFHALKDVSFQLARGEMIAIMGSSGSGKSTLMNIIGFLDRCSTGNYFFGEQNVSQLKDKELAVIRNQKIGFVFQSFFLLPRLNAIQNVVLPLFYRGIEKKSALDLSREMLAKVGMEKFSSHKPNQLSGGQQQRVAIARALVGEPEVVLADEPTGALDSKTGQDVMNLFLNLNRKEKRTIVLVTHDPKISTQCQRVVTLQDGAIISETK